jgi:hypothetical protein
VDRDIVDVFNGVMAAQERLLLGWNKTAVEIHGRNLRPDAVQAKLAERAVQRKLTRSRSPSDF